MLLTTSPIHHFPFPNFHLPLPRPLRVFPDGDGNVTMILITQLECKWKAPTEPDT